jgi:hypothetical protein
MTPHAAPAENGWPQNWDDWFMPGERLLWQGAPMPGLSNLWARAALALFGLPFLAGGAGMIASGLHHATAGIEGASTWGNLVLAVFVLPFLTLGLALVVGQWGWALREQRSKRYALSNRASYVARQFPGTKLSVYPIHRDTAVTLTRGHHGDCLWVHSLDERDSEGITTRQSGFENIADGAALLAMIRALQSSPAQADISQATP